MKRLKKYGSLLCLLLLLLAAFALPAYAAEEGTLSAADETDEDLFNAIFYTAYYSLYDFDDSVYDVKTAEELVNAISKTDVWARYYDAESYAAYLEGLQGQKCGIGIYYILEDGAVNVTGLVEGGAAQAAGVLSGDKIIAVDGKAIAEMAELEVTAAFAGEEGTEVHITLLRGEIELSMTLVRASFTLQSVSWEMLEDSIAYLSISSFTEQTGNELMTAYYDMMSQGAQGLILDLRDCPGGVMDGAVEVISALTDAQPALFLEYKNSFSIYPRSRNQEILLPMATLVNENSASAAELLAGTLQDCGRSVIIGTQTYGKGLMQNVISLPSGAGMVLTTARYLTTGWQDVAAQNGIYPDIYLTEPEAQLAKALEAVKRQSKAASELVFSYNSASVLADGAAVSFASAPFAYNGVSYLPLRETLSALGYEVFYYEGCVYISRGAEKLLVDTQNASVIRDKLVYAFDGSLYNGVLYASSSFLRDMLGCDLSWNMHDNTLSVKQ